MTAPPKSRRACLALALLMLSCARKPDKPKRTEPWPAQPSATASAREASAPISYVLAADSEVSFVLPAREAAPNGRARVVRGEIRLDMEELGRSRGAVEVDLGSIVLAGEDAGADDPVATERALSWLDLGSSRPEAERARLRWAKFELTTIEDLFSSAPHRAKLIREEARTSELRRAPLTAVGQLSLHGFRLSARVPLEVDFVYQGAATMDKAPSELVIRTRRPLVVSLSAHDIKPRDSTGVLLAQETKLLGVRVGRDARVSLNLRAKRK